VTATMPTATTGTIGVLRITTTLTATTTAVTATMPTATTGTIGVLRITTTLTATTTAVAAVAVVDASVTEVAGVPAAVPTGTAEAAMPAQVTEPAGADIPTTEAAVPEAAFAEAAMAESTVAEPTGTQTSVAEPTVGTTEATGAQTPFAEPTVGTTAEPAEAALGSAEPAVAPGAEVTEAPFGTPADLPTEPAEVRADALVPVLAEAAEVTEIAETARPTGHFGGRPVQQWAAEQAVGAGRRHVDAADALLTRGGVRQVRRVAGGGRGTGVVVAGDLVRRDCMGRGDVVRSRGDVVRRKGVIGRDVVVRQRMRRAAEEQGRLGQPGVECGRSPAGAGLDAEGAEFGELRGRQAQSSRHLVGVAVECGAERRVHGQAGQSSTIGVVGHGSVSVGLRALMPIAAEPRIPPGRRQLPFPAIPADTCRRRYRALA
ncbi:hypothetical protein ACWC12_10665, partial [Streptomyces sp. NPDC001450]